MRPEPPVESLRVERRPIWRKLRRAIYFSGTVAFGGIAGWGCTWAILSTDTEHALDSVAAALVAVVGMSVAALAAYWAREQDQEA